MFFLKFLVNSGKKFSLSGRFGIIQKIMNEIRRQAKGRADNSNRTKSTVVGIGYTGRKGQCKMGLLWWCYKLLFLPINSYDEGVVITSIPAFTIADLMEIVMSSENTTVFQRKGLYFIIRYKREIQIFSSSLRDVLFEAVEFLVKNIYIIP